MFSFKTTFCYTLTLDEDLHDFAKLRSYISAGKGSQLVSNFRINPSSTSTHLDYQENQDPDTHNQDEQQTKNKNTKPYLWKSGSQTGLKTTLKSRKASKKRQEKKKRKLAERQARKNTNDQ